MAHYADRINTAPMTLTDREQRLLLKVTGEHRSGFRDHVIIATALATGLRSHELLALDGGDVFGPDGRCRRRLQLRVFKRSNDDQGAQQVVLPDNVECHELVLAQPGPQRHRVENVIPEPRAVLPSDLEQQPLLPLGQRPGRPAALRIRRHAAMRALSGGESKVLRNVGRDDFRQTFRAAPAPLGTESFPAPAIDNGSVPSADHLLGTNP